MNLSLYNGYGSFGGGRRKINANGEEERINRLTGQKETVDPLTGRKECQSCKNRKYQDGSDDPGVSFKTAQSVSPERAASAVRGHEAEHVRRNRADADRNGDEIISQNVQIHTSVCPECGRTYVSGGTTTTTVAKAADEYKKAASFNTDSNAGKNIDLAA